MDIGFYIAGLLREQDEVSIPGIGTFMKVRIAGSYDQVSNSFIPPSQKLSFKNSASGYNALTAYISSKKNLSVSSSEYFIKKFSSNVFELLNSSGFAEIKPLGTIHKKKEKLLFEASGSFEIVGNFYGLKPVIDHKSKDTSVAEDAIQQEEETDETGNGRFKMVLALSMLIIVIGGMLLYTNNPAAYNLVQKLKSNIFPTAGSSIPESAPIKEQAIALPDSITKTGTDSMSADSQALKTKIPTNTIKTESAIETANSAREITYEIIGAAFARKNEAEIYIKKIQAKGIQAKIVENMPGALIKISLGSFKDEQSARTELIRIHKDINKEAWIARVKPKKNP